VTRDETRAAAVAAPIAAGDVIVSASAIGAAAGGKASSENFPVALRVLPARYRTRLAALYGFARSADDMGDEAPAPERLALLDELEADIRRLYGPGDGERGSGEPSAGRSSPAGSSGGGPGPAGSSGGGPGPAGSSGGQPGPARSSGGRSGGEGAPRLPVVRALAPAVGECAIPAAPFLDLIQANRQDQAVARYQTFDDLLAYCALSANPVGRVVLHIFGSATPARVALSDLVCTALQLAEHWQDVAEDFRAGRVYLPREDMDRFGCGEEDLAGDSAPPQVRDLLAFEVGRARELLDQGAPVVGTLRGAARLAVAGYVAGGRAALAAIAASGYDVLAGAPRPQRRRVVAELARAYATGR
jgi:squalene synthase HpnC